MKKTMDACCTQLCLQVSDKWGEEDTKMVDQTVAMIGTIRRTGLFMRDGVH